MTAAAALPLYVGYTWLIPVKLTDSNGDPIDISTWALAGDFWTPNVATPTTISASNVNVPAASFEFLIPAAITGQVAAMTPDARGYPCRIMPKYTSGGQIFALRPIFILPLDPRSSSV